AGLSELQRRAHQLAVAADDPSDPGAAQRDPLRQAVGQHDLLVEAGQRQRRAMAPAVVGELSVDLVRNEEDPAIAADRPHHLELGVGVDGARRIVRRAEQDPRVRGPIFASIWERSGRWYPSSARVVTATVRTPTQRANPE